MSTDDKIYYDKKTVAQYLNMIGIDESEVKSSKLKRISGKRLDYLGELYELTNADNLLDLGRDVTVISPYAYSFKSNVHKINGNLEYGAGEGLILDDNKITTLGSVNPGLLLTSLPMNDDAINSMIRCANDGYDALITACGDNKYGNYKDIIYRLKYLKVYVQDCFNLDTEVYDNNLDRIHYNALYIKGRRK